MRVEVELMLAGIPWTTIQEMPPEKVYLYRAFMRDLQETAKQQKHLEGMGGK
jgi:hypothetical protein